METAPTYLEVQALQWKNDSHYNFSKKTLSEMLVVNDFAERAILLAKTYPQTQMKNKNLIYTKWYPRCKEKFQTSENLLN